VVYSLNDGENAKFFRYLDIASEVAEKEGLAMKEL
jgi:hypothetical protein